MVNDSVVCKGDVISITCSADGKPAVHTYQLFEYHFPRNVVYCVFNFKCRRHMGIFVVEVVFDIVY